MSRPVILTKTLMAGSATAVSAAQTLGAAGNLLINGSAASGGVATLDTQRRILFTTTENDSALTWTIYGTNDSGAVIVDSGTLPSSSTLASNLDFKTVSRIAISGPIGANISVGTNTIGSTRWVLHDPYLTPSFWSFVCQLTGVANGTIEYTADSIIQDQPQSAVGYGYSVPTPLALPAPALQGISQTSEGAIDFPIRAWRFTINSGTGTWKTTGIQAGLIQ